MEHQDSVRGQSHGDRSTPGGGLEAEDTGNNAIVRVAGHVRDDQAIRKYIFQRETLAHDKYQMTSSAEK